MTKDKTEQVKQKVEEMGVFFEKAGHSPMNGRVFAYLLLSEPPYRDFYDIQEFLQASKSSISNALNKLMDEGVVDYITFSGDRKRYFRVSVKGWLNSIKGKASQVVVAKNLIKDVLDQRADSKHLDFNEGLQTMVEFHGFLAEEMEKALAKWEARQAVG